ncbi:lipoprotein [Actinocorallia lasiicapitis]
MDRGAWTRRVRYWFDNTMARGTPAMIGWLALISVSLVVAISTLEVAVDDKKQTSVANTLTEIWKNTVDTFHLGDADQGSLPFRILEILMALAGIFFASTLVSLITTGVNKRLNDLRKGRSAVLESGHTVILGWSEQVFPVLRELMAASANRGGDCVAILADRDRVIMEDAIRERIGTTGRFKIVCRRGDPLSHTALPLVSPQTARAVIVLAPDDARTTRTLLALIHSPARSAEGYHVIGSVTDGSNLAAAQLAGGHETLVVNADDIASRLIVQTARQPGLSLVYTGLLDFAGDEIYMADVPSLAGRTFGETLTAFRTSTVIGVQRRDGRVELAPAPASPLLEGDRIIAISRDDDTIVPGTTVPRVDEPAIGRTPAGEPRPVHVLVLGWNRRAARIITELDVYVPDGSSLHVVAEAAPLLPEPGGLAVTFTAGDTASRDVLQQLDLAAYQHVIVLCPELADAHDADCRTLITLLHLRELKEAAGHGYTIVSELGDDANRELAQVTRADDFIVGQRLISLLMVQLAENRDLHAVFAELFDPDGCELYLRPVHDYLVPGSTVDFYTAVEAARRLGHVAVGYRTADGEVRLNPDKALRVRFAGADRLIVLANGLDSDDPSVPRPRGTAAVTA